MKTKPKVGDEVYVVAYGRDSNHFENRYIEVTKVGREYFEIDYNKYPRMRFRVEGGYEDAYTGCRSFKCFTNKEEHEEELLKHSLDKKVTEFFIGYGLSRATLQQLKQIVEILNLQEEES